MTFNRERGEWPLTVGDRTLKMRLTTNAMAEVEGLSKGKTWDRIIDGLLAGSVTDCRLLMWAALRDHHPEIATDVLADVPAANGKPAQRAALSVIGDLIDEAGGLIAIVAQIKAFVQANAKPEDVARPQQAVTGDPGPQTVQ